MHLLSLLSRGCGEKVLIDAQHERLEVYFEPQDYFNWKSPRNILFVPLKLSNSCALGAKNSTQAHFIPTPPKTFSTRRGPLILYSEDLAHQSRYHKNRAKWWEWGKMGLQQISTLRDLTGAILSYGNNEPCGVGRNEASPYFHFIVRHKSHQGDRRIRPGYSAKRYLSNLSKSWDPNMVHRLQQAGYLSDSMLTRENPDARRKVISNLSAVPRPYRLLPSIPSVGSIPLYHACLVSPENEGAQGRSWQPVSKYREMGRNIVRWGPGRIHGWQHGEAGSEGQELEQGAGLYMLIAFPPDNKEHLQSQPPDGDCVEKGRRLGQAVIDSSFLVSKKSNITYYGGQLGGGRKGISVKGGCSGSFEHGRPATIPDGPQPSSLTFAVPSLQESFGVDVRFGKIREPETLQLPVIESGSEVTSQEPKIARGDLSEVTGVVLPTVKGIGDSGDAPSVTVAEHAKTSGQAEVSETEDESLANREGRRHAVATQWTMGLETDRSENGARQLTSMVMEGKRMGIKMDLDERRVEEGCREGPISRPTVLILPQIVGRKGPGNQSSMASFWTQYTNTKAPAKGIVRGSLPQVLRDAQKGNSVGSLIMGPDGQVVQLSLLGSIRGPRDTSAGTQEDKQEQSGLIQEEPWAGTMQQLEANAKTCGDNVALDSCQASELPNSDQECKRKMLRKNDLRPVMLDGDTSGTLGEDRKAVLLLPSHQCSDSNAANAEGSPEDVKHAVEWILGEDQKAVLLLPSHQCSDSNAANEEGSPEDVKHAVECISEGMFSPTNTPTGSIYSTASRISSSLGPTYSPVSSSIGSIYSHAKPFFNLIELIDSPPGQSQGEPGNKVSTNTLEALAALHGVDDSNNCCAQPPSEKSSQKVKDQMTTVESHTDTSTQDKEVDLKDQPGKRTADTSDTKKDYGGVKTMKKGKKDWNTPNKSSVDSKSPRHPTETENKKRNDRVSFVMGKPRGKQMQKQYPQNIKKQKKTSKNVSMEANLPQEEDDEGRKSMQRCTEVDGLLDSSDQIDSQTASASLMPLLSDQSSTSKIAVGMPHATVPAMEGSQLSEATKESTAGPALVKSEQVAKLQVETSRVKGEEKKNTSSAEEQKMSEWKLRAQKWREQELREQQQREQQQMEEEQLERQDRIKKELEDNLQKRMGKVRLQKLQQEEERLQLEAEQKNRQNQEQRERKQQEQYRRKLQELQQEKQRVLAERVVEAEGRRRAEEPKLQEEQQQREMEMSEPDELEYLRKIREDETWLQKQQLESWQTEKETTRRMMEGAKQEAVVLAHEKTLMDRHLQFNKDLIVESNGLERMHDITRPWVFSYFGLKKIVDVEPSPEE